MDGGRKKNEMPGINPYRFMLMFFIILIIGFPPSPWALQILPKEETVTRKTISTPIKTVATQITPTTLNTAAKKTLPPGTVKRFYSYQIQAMGKKPFVYNLKSAALPKGLTLGKTGLISGMPSSEGEFSFDITITDKNKRAVAQTFTLAIKPWPLSPGLKQVPEAKKNFLPIINVRSTLKVLDVCLFFENFGSNITVVNSKKPHKAYAAIRFEGVGWIEGLWKVNGKILSHVKERLDSSSAEKQKQIHLLPSQKTLTTRGAAAELTPIQVSNAAKGTSLKGPAGSSPGDAGQRADIKKAIASKDTFTIASPDLPVDPKMDKGYYKVQFVLTKPQQKMLTASATYDVSLALRKVKPTILLVFPEDKATVEDATTIFSWDKVKGASSYKIEFLDSESKMILLTDETQASEYDFKPSERKDIFSTSRAYLWRVTGYDKSGNIIGRSAEPQFTIRSSPTHVPGHILLVLRSDHAKRRLKDLTHKYDLRLIKTDSIRSLRQTMAVFGTEKDIYTTIKAIKKEKDIISAQPNHIFRTMSEPMSNMQSIPDLCHLEKIHKRYTGRNVTVGIVDTGVDTFHQDLKKQIVFHENFVENSPYRGEIHGTAVAGIIGAGINDFGISGVAPGAEILALRACQQVAETHPEGHCQTYALARALDTAIEKKADIVNMSFGSLIGDRLLHHLIEEGARRGVIFVAPVGNRLNQEYMWFPASHRDVLAVAGIDENGNPFPNAEIASKAGVCAPASNLFTTVPGQKHNFLNGTSMSSAVVSGLLAIAQNKHIRINLSQLPVFKGEFCAWAQELLGITLCSD